MTVLPARRRVCFVTRGRGRGHAVPDLAIAEALRKQDASLEIYFASYSIGAGVFREAGEPVYDMGLESDCEYNDSIVSAYRCLNAIRPNLVVSHEEPAALLAANLTGVRSVFVTHWFSEWEHPSTSALRYAWRVLFLGRHGLFAEPANVRGRVIYCGPFLRAMCVDGGDRDEVRAQLGLAPSERVVVVVQGSEGEHVAPLADLMMGAFTLLDARDKRLIWFAGGDEERVRARELPLGAEVRGVERDIERWLLASDAVVSKGTYNLSMELRALGSHFVVVSSGRNYIDDLYSQAMASRFLWKDDMCPETLANILGGYFTASRPIRDERLVAGEAASVAAQAIIESLQAQRWPLVR